MTRIREQRRSGPEILVDRDENNGLAGNLRRGQRETPA
jgi:hypothetical protein